jgi:hypothetical protein
MARPNPIRKIMEMELPSLSYQRYKSYRPHDEDIDYAYNIINKYVFDNRLRKPELMKGRLIHCWGECSWYHELQDTGSYTTIKISDKWFCPQWFMNTLAHEMVHQYQWDVYRWDHYDLYGKDIYQHSAGHGPSFFMWRDRFDHYGLNLKTWFRQRKWFKYQDFNKA